MWQACVTYLSANLSTCQPGGLVTRLPEQRRWRVFSDVAGDGHASTTRQGMSSSNEEQREVKEEMCKNER